MKVPYTYLQKMYPQKIVALNKNESKVIAVGLKFDDLLKKLGQKSVDPKSCVFVGPIQKQGTINVYISLRKKADR